MTLAILQNITRKQTYTMIKSIKFLLFVLVTIFISCKQNSESSDASTQDISKELSEGPAALKTDSNPNIMQVLIGSKDNSTFVKALNAAGLFDALINAGPYTIFAPTNAAFDKLPVGTLENLLKPENLDNLEILLGYHTYIGILKTANMKDGDEYEMVYGGKIKITKKEEQVFVNGSPVAGTIETSNGIIHIIGDVLLPK